jgi:uncharacterized membrane protein YphA (DoxX/SURF4 family)
MKYLLFMFIFLFICVGTVWSHEQWLLSSAEISVLSSSPKPLVFSQLTLFNGFIFSINIFSIIFWIALTQKIGNATKTQLSSSKLNYALFGLRFWTGLMLILCGLGLLPKSTHSLFQEPTLFAPDLLINQLPPQWHFLQWLEVSLGILLIIGFYSRWLGLTLFILVIASLMLFGEHMYHYIGFYSAISIFISINGGGAISIRADKNIRFKPFSLLIMQCLTGFNFIYSALAIKWYSPNVDIVLLQKTQAFTFGISLDKFVFIMLITELSFGVLFILGRQMRIITSVMFMLFIFLSFNLSENILAHSMIYGIFTVLIVLEGYPLGLHFNKSGK